MAEEAPPVSGKRLVTSHSAVEYLQRYASNTNGHTNGHANGNGLKRISKGTKEIRFSIAGVVDPTSLLPYMEDCHCGEFENPRERGLHWPEFHHLYFPRPLYDTRSARPEHKKLHRLRYNQIGMLSCQEDFYHQQHVTD